MRCEDARRFLGPYLDSELDPKTNLEIARHLEGCDGCRERFDAERRLERSIALEIRKPEPGDDATWRRALERAGRPRVTGWRWAAGFLAAGLAAAVVWASLRPNDGLAADLRKDYGEYKTGQWHLDVLSSDPGEIEQFFRFRMGLAVKVPQKVGDLVLIGGRKCSLRGVPTAFLAYRGRGADVSLFVFSADHLDRFSGRQPLPIPLVDESGEVPVVALRSGWKMVCAAGPLPSAELASFCRTFPD